MLVPSFLLYTNCSRDGFDAQGPKTQAWATNRSSIQEAFSDEEYLVEGLDGLGFDGFGL